MTLDVAFSPLGLGPGAVQGRTVFVIDILRAVTTMCAAFSHGARAVIPVADTEEALRLAQTLGEGDVVLAGERHCIRIPGFALGNSPGEMTEQAVRGKTIIMTTTNGTGALLACQGAREVYLTAATNLSVAAARTRALRAERQDLLILCAGRENHFALDDAYCAGRLIAETIGPKGSREDLSDAAVACLDLVKRYGNNWAAPLAASRGGRDLAALGLGEDIAAAARMDCYPVLLSFHERRVTALPSAA